MGPNLNTLSARLLLGSGIPIALFVAAALVADLVLARLTRSLEKEHAGRQVVLNIAALQSDADRMQVAYRAAATGDRAELRADYTRARDDFLATAARLRDLLRDQGPLLRHVDKVLTTEAERHAVVRELFDDNAPAGAALRDGRVVAASRSIAGGLASSQEEALRARDVEALALARQCTWTIAITVPVATILAVIVALQAARSVTGPVDRLRQAAGDLLAGRFRMVRPSGPDELAQLAVHFNHMGLTLTDRAGSLGRERDRYRSYLGATSQIMWTASADGRVTADIPAWRAYTGQTEAELLGEGWADAVHPDDRGAALAAWRRAVAEERVFEAEFRLREVSGEYRPFHSRGVPVPGPSGGVREWIGTCTDVSEEKQRDALRQEKEAAEAANRAKSEFLTKMSHELRTPLNAVIGMSNMLATQRFGPLTPKQADYVGDIARAGGHLLDLINDILDLSRVEAGRLELRPEPFALPGTVAGVVSTLQPLADEKHLRLEVRGGPDGELDTDPARFRQVLYNLLSNAVKFTPPGGAVVVSWEEAAEPRRGAGPGSAALVLTVRDTGVGIADADSEVIWDEFRQLAPPPGGRREGTGLGLALSRRLARLLGGDLWLQASEPGHGSTFAFALPRQPPRRTAGDGEAAAPPDRPAALVVEDHEPTSKLVCDWLREAGLRPAAAMDVASARALLRQGRPAVVVLDICLPDGSGWQLLGEWRNQGPRPPVLVVTVTDDDPPPDHGAAGVFVKPLDRESFLARVRELVPEVAAGSAGAGG
jgi:PAS domain S-box-containing protein